MVALGYGQGDELWPHYPPRSHRQTWCVESHRCVTCGSPPTSHCPEQDAEHKDKAKGNLYIEIRMLREYFIPTVCSSLFLHARVKVNQIFNRPRPS